MKDSRILFGRLRQSAAIFSNLWKMSGNLQKMFGNVCLVFGPILENLRKSWENRHILYNEKKITWSLDIRNLSYRVTCKNYFSRSLRSLVKYFSTLKDKFSISAQRCNILYLCVFLMFCCNYAFTE